MGSPTTKAECQRRIDAKQAQIENYRNFMAKSTSKADKETHKRNIKNLQNEIKELREKKKNLK